jgi:transcription initiation factor TFIIIB Brf1 subunit/transcription initiation factor TFIIB
MRAGIRKNTVSDSETANIVVGNNSIPEHIQTIPGFISNIKNKSVQENKKKKSKKINKKKKNARKTLRNIMNRKEQEPENRIVRFEMCPGCNTKVEDPVIDEGKKICRNCGTTVCDNLTFDPEFRFYGNDKSKNGENNIRCGIPFNPLLPVSSMGTIIMTGGGHSNQMRRIKRYHNWNSMPYLERARYHVFDEIANVCNRAGVPELILKEAQSLYVLIRDNSITRGSKRRGIIAACLYYAFKNRGYPRNSKEVAEMFNITTSEMTNGCKFFQQIMTTNDTKEGRDKVQAMKCSMPKDFIPRFCSHLSLNDMQFIKLCTVISERAFQDEIATENTPPSVACAIIYMLSMMLGLEISIKTIHSKCSISEVTINKCFKTLWTNRRKIIPKQINQMYDSKQKNKTGRKTKSRTKI